MKSQKTKKIILALLIVVLFVIWWDNLKLLSGNRSQYNYSVIEDTRVSTTGKKQMKDLTYKSPRINPFRRPTTSGTDDTRPQPKVTTATSKIEKPSSKHKLLGVLKDKARPQVVMNSPQDATSVLSLSDSIDNWVLVAIDTSYAVFQNDKLYDTLWLENKISLQ